MARKFRFVALVNAKEGCDDAFNAWHTEIHLPEVARIAGFTRGERMRLVEGSNGDATRYRYLVMFEGESDDPYEPLQKIGAAGAAHQINMSDTLGEPNWSSMFEEIPGAVYCP